MTTSSPAKTSNASKKLARLAAVQALYQSSFPEQTLNVVLADSIEKNFPALHEVGENQGEEPAIKGTPDEDLFGLIAQGVAAHEAQLDELIRGALSARLADGKMELLLLTILRAGVFELYHNTNVAAGIIISDYVDVARAFFDSKEPGLVNAILDKLGKNLRQA